MTLPEARKVLARYRLRHTECFSTPEMADALEAVLRSLDGQPHYTQEQMRKWLESGTR